MKGPARGHVLLLSLLSGLLWTLAWPAVGGFTPLVFVAWLPLLLAEELHDQRTQGRSRAFAPYAMAGFVLWNLCTTWWLGAVSEPWPTRLLSGGFPTFGNTLLMGLVVALARWVRRTTGQWAGRFAFIVLWLAFEHLHYDWDLQWPWLTLGNVFATHPEWVQWYEVTGALGGSLWILLVNLFGSHLLMAIRSREQRSVRVAAITVGLLLLVPLVGSAWRWGTYVPEGVPLEVVVVQPNVDPYTEKFGGLDAMQQLDRMLAQAEAVMTDSTVLIVMPETALQERTVLHRGTGNEMEPIGLWENDLDASLSVQRIKEFITRHPQVGVLSGMSSLFLFDNATGRSSTARIYGGTDLYYDAFNAALMVDSSGEARSYHKSKLVVGVEKLPFASILGELDALSIDLGGTTGSLGEQDERTVFRTQDPRVAVAPMICYESVFGDHVAEHVRNGAGFLAIMTNDGWWGTSPGYRQHLQYGRLRAVENRRDIARSANTGISCFIDQRGTIHSATEYGVPAAVRGTVRARTELSLFSRYGDQVGRVAVFLAVLVLLVGFVQYLRSRR